MPWDSDKQNFTERSEVGESEKLSAAEWNAHVTDQKDHSARHESGGIDEITVEGLSGDLADPQDPKQAVVNDFVDTLVDGGDKVTTTYDSGAGTLTIDTSALDTEEVEDAVAALVTAGNAITVNYDDVNDSLSIGVDESALSFYDGTNLTAPVDNESVSTGEGTITNLDGADLQYDAVDIDQFSTGPTFTVFQTDSYIAALSHSGKIVAGGPDSVNVADETDFAEILAELVNNQATGPPAIHLGMAPHELQGTMGVRNEYLCKSSVTLDNVFSLFGQGRNRTNIVAGDSVANSDVFTILGGGSNILRIDSVKFDSETSNLPDHHVVMDGVEEIIITHCEFRDANIDGLQVLDATDWNSIIDTWFLTGAGLDYQGDSTFGDDVDLRFIGNRVKTKGTPTEISFTDVDKLVRRGNEIDDSVTVNFTNVGFTRPNENFGKADGEELSVTNETFVIPTRDTDTASTTAGTFVNGYDAVDEDNRDEFNKNNNARFTPNKSGRYLIIANFDIRGSTVSGDELVCSIKDIDAGTTINANRTQATSSVSIPTFVFFEELSAGVSYEIQVTNNDSSFVVTSGNDTKARIVWNVVG